LISVDDEKGRDCWKEETDDAVVMVTVFCSSAYCVETMTGLGRVARKLDVDVAPAMVGWDFHNGFNHPM